MVTAPFGTPGGYTVVDDETVFGSGATAEQWADVLMYLTDDDFFFAVYVCPRPALPLMVRVKDYVRKRAGDKAFLKSMVENVVKRKPRRVGKVLAIAVTYAIPDLARALFSWAGDLILASTSRQQEQMDVPTGWSGVWDSIVCRTQDMLSFIFDDAKRQIMMSRRGLGATKTGKGLKKVGRMERAMLDDVVKTVDVLGDARNGGLLPTLQRNPLEYLREAVLTDLEEEQEDDRLDTDERLLETFAERRDLARKRVSDFQMRALQSTSLCEDVIHLITTDFFPR